jgi:hypothetical protein
MSIHLDTPKYIETIVFHVWRSINLWRHVGPRSLARFVMMTLQKEGEVSNQSER